MPSVLGMLSGPSGALRHQDPSAHREQGARQDLSQPRGWNGNR